MTYLELLEKHSLFFSALSFYPIYINTGTYIYVVTYKLKLINEFWKTDKRSVQNSVFLHYQ